MHSVALIEAGFGVAGSLVPDLFFMVIPMRWIQEDCVMNRGEIRLSIAAPRRHPKTIQSIDLDYKPYKRIYFSVF